MHGGHLRQSGQKISKSTGNTIRVPDLVERGIDPLSFRWLTFQTRYRSEMDFTWEAMDAADAQGQAAPPPHGGVGHPAPMRSGAAAKGYDARFREAVAADLDMPAALVVVNELVGARPRCADVEKYALLASWDAVLGLDLEREATSGLGPERGGAGRVVADRDAARDAKDYADERSAARRARGAWASRSWTPPRARRSAPGD